MAKSGKHVAALTGARALAGLYILLLHFGRPLFAHAPRWAQTLRANGYVATSFFLMLSGFVLTVAYGKRFVDGRLDRKSFLVARVARLYPCYALALVVMLPFAFVHGWGSVTSAFGDASLRFKLVTGVAHATMMHVWTPRLVTSWNVPDWCVSVEMWFYVAFPLVVPWVLARPTRTLVAILVAAWGVALALSIGYTWLRPDGFVATLDTVGFWLSLFKFTPYTRWPEPLFGIALGALWLRLPAEGRGGRFATPLVASGALVTLALLVEGDRIPYSMLHNGTLLPLYGVIVWGLMLGDGPLHRALASRPLTTMGDASYVLYIMQVPIMQWLVLVSGRRYGHDGMDAPFTAVALVVTAAAAIAIHHLFETRAQAWLHRRLEGLVQRRAAPLVPAPVAEIASG